MARSPLLLGVLLGLALATGLGAAALRRPLDHGPVYTVAQVRAQLDRDPAAWMRQMLWVRGRIAGCRAILPAGAHSVCRDWDRYYLTDTDEPATEPLERGSPAPLLLALRRLPPLGGLLPAPQAVDWGEVATYRVELRAMPGEPCGAATCYEAVLLDAAPTSSGEG
jgi:hypothetical protein